MVHCFLRRPLRCPPTRTLPFLFFSFVSFVFFNSASQTTTALKGQGEQQWQPPLVRYLTPWRVVWYLQHPVPQTRNQNHNQKNFNGDGEMGKFVCHSSDRILQKQRTVAIAKISNTVKKGRRKKEKRNRHIYKFT